MKVGVENIVVTPGAVTAMATSLLTLAEAQEEILIPDPGWPNYEMATRCIGAVPVRYPLDVRQGFMPDFGALEYLVTDRTKVMISNTPANPTGAVFPGQVMGQLVTLCRKHDLYLLSDEVYEDIVFEGEHVSAAPLDEEGRVVSVFGFSKSYAMTGWRLGYAVAARDIAMTISKMQEPFVSCASAISQKAAEAALWGSQDAVRTMCDAYRQRRDAAIRILKENGLFVYSPQGAFYLLVDISGCGRDSYAFATDLLQDKRVAVAPGATFGRVGEGYIRISLATAEEQIVEGLRRICSYILELREG
jgi:aspartate aminotransferase/aminotransferase